MEDAVREVEILVAARPIPAHTMVDGKSVVSKTVPADLAPEGYLSDPIQAAGGVLALPMVEGQVFTAACFLNEGRIPIPPGMRAFSLKLATYAAGLLYPGCLVDVLVSFKLPSKSGRPASSRDEALSMDQAQDAPEYGQVCLDCQRCEPGVELHANEAKNILFADLA